MEVKEHRACFTFFVSTCSLAYTRHSSAKQQSIRGTSSLNTDLQLNPSTSTNEQSNRPRFFLRQRPLHQDKYCRRSTILHIITASEPWNSHIPLSSPLLQARSPRCLSASPSSADSASRLHPPPRPLLQRPQHPHGRSAPPTPWTTAAMTCPTDVHHRRALGSARPRSPSGVRRTRLMGRASICRPTIRTLLRRERMAMHRPAMTGWWSSRVSAACTRWTGSPVTLL